ncbi:MAG: tetratricopeptide repeat protein [Burkholderiaceae bacterium]
MLFAVLTLSTSLVSTVGAQSTPANASTGTRPAATDRESTRLQNDAIESIKSALDGRRSTEALQVAEKALKQFPANVQMRFLYGVALTDAGQTDQAIEHFQTMVLDHPELAEPYNNLAVLHAQRGDLKAARDSLESAIANGPAYTLAYENLGDVYLRLAVQAYESGSEAPAATAVIRRKLVLTRSLVEQVSPDANR